MKLVCWPCYDHQLTFTVSHGSSLSRVNRSTPGWRSDRPTERAYCAGYTR